MEQNSTTNALTYQMLTDEKHNTASPAQLKAATLQLSLTHKIPQEQDMAQIVHRQGEGSNKNGFSVVSSDKEALRLRVQDTQNAKQMQAQK